MSKRRASLIACCLLCACASPCRAQTLDLANGDRISGEVRCDADTAVVTTAYAGDVRIARTSLTDDVCPAAEIADDEATVKQSGKVRAGYESVVGDTNSRASSGGFEFSRETDIDETTAEGDMRYARDSAGSVTQQALAKTRYAHDIGVSPWYLLAKGEAAQDKAGDVRLRLMPQCGLGYYFWDTDRWKVSFENAFAYEVTNYYRATNVDSTAATQRLYALWMIDDRLSLREELDQVISLATGHHRRLRNQIVGSFALDTSWSVDVRLITHYEPESVAGTAKYNSRFITALAYGF